MKEGKQLEAINYEVDGDRLTFNVKRITTDIVVDSICSARCSLNSICFGQSTAASKNARLNLSAPLVQNLSSEEAKKIPCHAGRQILKNRVSFVQPLTPAGQKA